MAQFVIFYCPNEGKSLQKCFVAPNEDINNFDEAVEYAKQYVAGIGTLTGLMVLDSD